jgi:hypothetical protein
MKRGVEERDYGPRGRVITGERGECAAAMMVGELDRRETADAVKCFCFGVERCCGEPSSTRRWRTRPLNRILEAAQMRREPKQALIEQNERWGAVFGTALRNVKGNARARAQVPLDLAAWCRRER